MPNLPTPLRAALGLAATAVDEARKLPETLPQAVTTVPMIAVSTAMQASMKVQQHLAVLAARGDEVLSHLRGRSAEPPSWATFDDDGPSDDAGHSPNTAGYPSGNAGYAADEPRQGKAAFDLIDYDTGFPDGDEGNGRWDAVGIGGVPTEASPTFEPASTDPEPTVTATPPVAAGPTPAAPDLAGAVSAPGTDTAGLDAPDGLFPPDPGQAEESPAVASSTLGRGSRAVAKTAAPRKTGPTEARPTGSGPTKTGPTKTGPTKTGPAKARAAKAAPTKAEAAKAGPTKTAPVKAAPVKVAPVKAGAVKAGPAKAAKAPAKRAGRKGPDHEPLEQAAKKAKPTAAPNPSTMAAEIVQAHEAANDGE